MQRRVLLDRPTLKKPFQAYYYMFKSDRWLLKLLVGGIFTILNITVIGGFFALGYQVEVVSGLISGIPQLPSWRDLAGLFQKGANLFLVSFIWELPSFFLSFINHSWATDMSLGWSAFFLFCYPVILTAFVSTKSIREALRFKKILEKVQLDIPRLLIVFAVYLVSLLLSAVSLLVLLIGIAIGLFWAQLVLSYLSAAYFLDTTETQITSQ